MDVATDQLDLLIERRARQNGEHERPAEVMYAESVRRYNSAKDAERRAEWAEFHRVQAERHRRTLEELASYHEAAARAALNPAAVNSHPLVEGARATGRGADAATGGEAVARCVARR